MEHLALAVRDQESEEPQYVSIEFRDPDGYVVEFAWEIPEPNEP